MAETIVIIAIPVITLVVTSVVVIRDELKTQKSREAMFEECKRCPLYGGDENTKLRELVCKSRCNDGEVDVFHTDMVT